jgi:hypothetical protein
MICSRFAVEKRRCLPSIVHGIWRWAARRRSHDSGTFISAAACDGVNNTGPASVVGVAEPARGRRLGHSDGGCGCAHVAVLRHRQKERRPRHEVGGDGAFGV